MKKGVVIGLIVAGLLGITNPGMEAFRSFARVQAADRIERELGRGTLGELLGGAGSEVVAENISQFTTRKSYLVASIFTVDVDRNGTPDGRVLGIAGQFVVLDEFEMEE